MTVIGAGNVGATIAYTLAVEGVANEIVMIDIKKEKAEGEVMDISQGSPFFSGTDITVGDYADAADSDIVIITSGVARKPDQTRLDLAQTNINVLKSISAKITKYAPDAIYLIVSNPVDVMTYVFHKITNIPEHHIIGSGTILDTARLRSMLAYHFDISQQNVHAFVFGEHGDSAFIPWSQTNISCVNIEQYQNSLGSHSDILPINQAELEHHVRASGAEIISRKGATYYAVALAAVHICKCIFSGDNTAVTVSSMMHGEYGVDDVCLSTVKLVGRDGIKMHIPTELTAEEIQKLHHSAKCLKGVLKQLQY